MIPPSIGVPGGVGGPEGCGGFCAEQTKLINTNKIEANVLLFCIIIEGVKVKKKLSLQNFSTLFYLKKAYER